MMVVVILLVFTIPLVCWALLARSAMTGDRVGAVLTCLVLAEIAAARQWFFGEARVTLITALVIASGGDSMPARGAAPSSSVLPLGRGIAVASDTASCTGQAGNSCLRIITLRDTLGRPTQQFSDAVLSGLERRHGWRFSDEVACRPGGGWALDHETVCVSVDDLTELPLVVVDVETDNGP